MPTVRDDTAFTHTILPGNLKQASYKPTVEEAAKAKALINFLMEDAFFLALYRSNDPKVRAAAMDKLNEAHHQAYGVSPTKGGVAGKVPGAEAEVALPRHNQPLQPRLGIIAAAALIAK
jgi:hypothetical protein